MRENSLVWAHCTPLQLTCTPLQLTCTPLQLTGLVTRSCRGVAAPPYSSQLKSCGDLTPPQVAQKVVEAPHFPQFLRLRRAKINFPIPLSRLQAPCLAPFTLGCPPQTHGTARR